MAQPKFFCIYPWKHLHYGETQGRQPCCRSLDRFTEIASIADLDWLNSPDRVALRKKFLDGEIPQGCSKCAKEESLNIPSLRQAAVKELGGLKPGWDARVNSEEIEYLEYFLGTTCNLKCLMCDATNSSKWLEDYQVLGWELPPKRGPGIELSQLLDKFPNVQHIKLVGGETFMFPNVAKILSQWQNLAQVEISLYTNVTVAPTIEWIQVFARAKKININLSIDGVGPLNDYLRFPSRWAHVQNTLKAFWDIYAQNKKVEMRVHTVVTVLNLLGLTDLYEWWNGEWEKHGRGPFRPGHELKMTPIMDPSCLKVDNVPIQLREKFCLQMESLPVFGSRMQSAIRSGAVSGDIETLANYIRQLDKARDVRLGAVNPELAQALGL